MRFFQCRPYYVKESILLLGDAAHAVVPFYGQGMNAGFEDCSILSELLSKHRQDFNAALNEFSATRWEDAHAISDLAMYNYTEVCGLKLCDLYRVHGIHFVLLDARFGQPKIISIA